MATKPITSHPGFTDFPEPSVIETLTVIAPVDTYSGLSVWKADLAGEKP